MTQFTDTEQVYNTVPLSLTVYRQLVDGSSSTLPVLLELRTNYSHICIVY